MNDMFQGTGWLVAAMIYYENVIEFSLNSFQLSSSSVITLCDKMNDVFQGTGWPVAGINR